MTSFNIITILYGITFIFFAFAVLEENKSSKAADRCFCELNGEVDDCECKVDAIHTFNLYNIYPRLKSLLEKNYFRFFEVNLNRECPFWVDDSKCSLKDCHVKNCEQNELPEGLRKNGINTEHEKSKYYTPLGDDGKCKDENSDGLGHLDTSISEESQNAINKWIIHDDQQDTFCELDDDRSGLTQHVDLLKNPERYTGYVGPSAHRIWKSIYEENCFDDPSKAFSMQYKPSVEQCLEKRVFYRLISGLHTSINLHLCNNFLLKDSKLGFDDQVWGPNVKEFLRRFDPEHERQGPVRLKNLYFTYLVELRALAKSEPYIRSELFYTGNKEEDEDTRKAVDELFKSIREFPHHFDESKLFQGDSEEATSLKQIFKARFRNISRIMDCVGCDKCKLWGKLQVQGMGTALKILFSGDSMSPDSFVAKEAGSKFQLRRTEIVTLFNAIGRLSSSLHAVDTFRKLLSKE